MTRASWDAVWLYVCDAIAQRSKCHRRQIGAAVVTLEQELVSVGFNGAPPGYVEEGPDCRSWCARAGGDAVGSTYTNCPSVHAEMNALVRAGRAPAKSRTLYVSSSVCMDCAKVAPSAGISRVVMRVDWERDAHRNPRDVAAFLASCGVEVLSLPDTMTKVPDVTPLGNGAVAKLRDPNGNVKYRYQVWSEGYAATGERGLATLHGYYWGSDFQAACIEAATQWGWGDLFDAETLTYWGCKLFPTESQARATFG